MKPNLFVIGAMKCGTSSLHEYLSAHPQIVMSTVKEPGFFVDDPASQCAEIRDHAVSGTPSLDRYLALFPGREEKTYAGESSTYYTKWPHTRGVAQRLWEFNADARLIYIVRDPVERAISHYRFNCQMGWEAGGPDELRRNPRYWDVGNYAMQLRQYLAHFPKNQIHVLALEDLTAQP